MNSLEINGEGLRAVDIFRFVTDSTVKVKLSKSVFASIKSSYEFLASKLRDTVIYGVNTGLGPMASYLIGKEQLIDLQTNLIRSHATGMGEPLRQDFVFAAMLVRLNTLSKGYSCVSVELIERLVLYLNERIAPVIPTHGAVGTSGDLVQLAHIALAIIGEGEVDYKGKRRQAIDVIKELGIEPYKLKPKEGLALINGTSVMSGIASILWMHAKNLLNIEIKNSALSLELIQAYNDGISKELHNLRPHPGQIEIAKSLRELLETSQLLRKRDSLNRNNKITDTVHQISDFVQEVYSFRCTPQILGPILETVTNSLQVIEIEINSVTDNPVLDREHKEFLHGGNFHGDYIAVTVDQIKMSLVKLSILSERRINFFMNQSINKFFPPFLNLNKPGLTLALQGLQFVATSTTAQNQSYAFPHSIHSIPTNAYNQDVVSMGTDASLILDKVVENTYIVTTIEAVTLAQAVDFLQFQEKLAKSTHEMYNKVREKVATVIEDRSLTKELSALVEYFKSFANG